MRAPPTSTTLLQIASINASQMRRDPLVLRHGHNDGSVKEVYS
jgi:hypothetical protein